MQDKINRRAFLHSSLGAAALAFGGGSSASVFAQATALDGPVITRITTYPLKRGFFIKIEANDGSVGWGECDRGRPKPVEALIHQHFRNSLIGAPVFSAEPLWDTLFFGNHDGGPGGILPNAIAGIDIALWDLRGKILQRPVYQLIGGAYRHKLQAYASFGVDGGRSMSPAKAAETAKRLLDQGFSAIKLRMQIRESNFNPHPDPTLPYARAVRKAIGDDIELLIDINNGYSAGRAVQVGLDLFEELGVRYLEEPCSDQNHQETRQVVNELAQVQIIAGEKEYTRWQLAELIRDANPDILNPDITKAGGITEMKKIAAIAQANSKPMMCHNTRPTVGSAASLHFCASISHYGPFIEYPDIWQKYPELMPVLRSPPLYRDGYLHLPEGIGLGVELDEQKLASMAYSVVTA